MVEFTAPAPAALRVLLWWCTSASPAGASLAPVEVYMVHAFAMVYGLRWVYVFEATNVSQVAYQPCRQFSSSPSAHRPAQKLPTNPEAGEATEKTRVGTGIQGRAEEAPRALETAY